MNCTLLTIDDDDEGSEDKDAHIRNGETVPKQLEAPPLGQTLGLKRFFAAEFSAVFNVNTSANRTSIAYTSRYSSGVEYHVQFCINRHWASNGALQQSLVQYSM